MTQAGSTSGRATFAGDALTTARSPLNLAGRAALAGKIQMEVETPPGSGQRCLRRLGRRPVRSRTARDTFQLNRVSRQSVTATPYSKTTLGSWTLDAANQSPNGIPRDRGGAARITGWWTPTATRSASTPPASRTPGKLELLARNFHDVDHPRSILQAPGFLDRHSFRMSCRQSFGVLGVCVLTVLLTASVCRLVDRMFEDDHAAFMKELADSPNGKPIPNQEEAPAEYLVAPTGPLRSQAEVLARVQAAAAERGDIQRRANPGTGPPALQVYKGIDRVNPKDGCRWWTTPGFPAFSATFR